MARVKKDNERENRIVDEIIVDAYGAEEQAMGWYYYLEEAIWFPFYAKSKYPDIIRERARHTK